MSFIQKLKQYLIGAPINPFNPNTLKHVSLIALLAWVGLGADGLSSSCYGPEEAFLALGSHSHLALYIAFAMAMTVFIISFGYNQVIELFPTGGGGYKVATQLLSPWIGLVSGAALLIDYVLTIAVSIASGTDAVFSIVPAAIIPYKSVCEQFFLLFLIILNLRGMKESIKFLLPIFLGFFVTHVGLIIYGISAHHQRLIPLVPQTLSETHALAQTLGWFPLLALMLHSYSLGGGTYTGLEAVSNNVNKLAEPRVKTGKWTMMYMAISLSFTAGGTILLYLLWDAKPIDGQTLNAVVFHTLLGDSSLGKIVLTCVLLLEGGLLFVAANTGFLAGPSVLANMAVDGWVPNRFRHLSTRLVVQNGVLLFGICAGAILYFSHGEVHFLVILYSINVFLTFSLSLLGMCVYWCKHRAEASPKWRLRFVFSAFAFALTSSILCVTLYTKFLSGGWVTILITAGVIALCAFIKRHYNKLAKKLAYIDVELQQPLLDRLETPLALDPTQPTAVIMVGKNIGIGMHTLLCVLRLFPRHYKNFIFLNVGIVDVGSFSEQVTLNLMREDVHKTLNYFVTYCHQYGLPAEAYAAYGTDTVEQLSKLAEKVSSEFPSSIFFASKLIFEQDSWLTRLLHNETAITLQRQLHIQGKEVVILPMRIM
jgi:hypothetical protein